MNVKVIKDEKEELQIEIDNLTIAELLRSYLWQDESVILAVWKRDHPTKKPILVIKTKGKSAKKALQDTIDRIESLNAKLISEFKKIK